MQLEEKRLMNIQKRDKIIIDIVYLMSEIQDVVEDDIEVSDTKEGCQFSFKRDGNTYDGWEVNYILDKDEMYCSYEGKKESSIFKKKLNLKDYLENIEYSDILYE